jgi:hypothetical protein
MIEDNEALATLDQLTSDLDDIVVVSMGAPSTGAVKAASSCCCSACCCCVHINTD